jgi:hypothetical protein
MFVNLTLSSIETQLLLTHIQNRQYNWFHRDEECEVRKENDLFSLIIFLIKLSFSSGDGFISRGLVK